MMNQLYETVPAPHMPATRPYSTANMQQVGTIMAPQEINFNTPGMQGSMQQALADNLGLYAVIEFVVGTQEMARKEGILYSVGRSFVVLYDQNDEIFILCDIFSVKFVTLYLPGRRPWRVADLPKVPMVDIPGVGLVPAGQYGIGTGSAPNLITDGTRQEQQRESMMGMEGHMGHHWPQ